MDEKLPQKYRPRSPHRRETFSTPYIPFSRRHHGILVIQHVFNVLLSLFSFPHAWKMFNAIQIHSHPFTDSSSLIPFSMLYQVNKLTNHLNSIIFIHGFHIVIHGICLTLYNSNQSPGTVYSYLNTKTMTITTYAVLLIIEYMFNADIFHNILTCFQVQNVNCFYATIDVFNTQS